MCVVLHSPIYCVNQSTCCMQVISCAQTCTCTTSIYTCTYVHVQHRVILCLGHGVSEREEFNGTKIIFLGQSIRKLLMRTLQSTNYARPTQCEQTIASYTCVCQTTCTCMTICLYTCINNLDTCTQMESRWADPQR